jgi:predicted DNA-binding transcriptional regulator AlpA
MKEYLTEREVVELTGRALSTLRNDRATGRGFPYVKWGRFVRYRKRDVIAFMESHKVKPMGNQYDRRVCGN